MASYNRLKNLEAQIIDEVKKVTNENTKSIKSKLQFFFSESFNQTSYAVETSLGVDLGFGLLDPLVAEVTYKNLFEKIKWEKSIQDHAQKYITDIRQELTQGLIQGKGYGKIAAIITDKTGINANKALRIVRTEGHKVQNAARILSYDKTEAAAGRLGLESARVWVATLDARTRDSHGEMDGQEADAEGMFHYPNGGVTPAPGVQGPAEEVINCRCNTAIQFKEFPPAFRKDNITKEILKHQTYAEWKKGKEIKY
jgi:uncharacterized protein with gpF-like domain